jgi:hypothetical protein
MIAPRRAQPHCNPSEMQVSQARASVQGFAGYVDNSIMWSGVFRERVNQTFHSCANGLPLVSLPRTSVQLNRFLIPELLTRLSRQWQFIAAALFAISGSLPNDALHPVGGDFARRDVKIQLSLPHYVTEAIFERVLHLGVPNARLYSIQAKGCECHRHL